MYLNQEQVIICNNLEFGTDQQTIGWKSSASCHAIVGDASVRWTAASSRQNVRGPYLDFRIFVDVPRLFQKLLDSVVLVQLSARTRYDLATHRFYEVVDDTETLTARTLEQDSEMLTCKLVI